MVCAQRSRLQQQEDAMQIVQAGTCGKRIVCTVQPHRPTTDHSSKMVLRPRLLHCLVQSGCGVLCTVPHMTSSTTLQLLGLRNQNPTAVTFLEFSFGDALLPRCMHSGCSTCYAAPTAPRSSLLDARCILSSTALVSCYGFVITHLCACSEHTLWLPP